MKYFRIASAVIAAFLVMAAAPAFAQTATSTATTTASTTASTTLTADMVRPVLNALGGVLATISTRISTQGVESIPNRPLVSQILGGIGNILASWRTQLGGTATVTGTTGTPAGTVNTGVVTTPGFPNTGEGPDSVQSWQIFAALSFLAGTGLLVHSFRAN